MKKSTCLLVVVFCLSLQMMAQVKKTAAKPATPAMPDIEKMLKDLPPDQQKMAREMLGNATGKTAVIKTETPVAAPSPIIKIKLAKPVNAPTEAQATDRLLWYKGKKINDSMLVTTKAMLVLYSNKRNMVVAEPLEKTDSFRLMVKNVSKEAKMTEDYIEAEAEKKNGFLNYPLIQMTVDRFEVLDEQFNNALKNTIDLPEVPKSNSVPQSTKVSPKNHNVDLEKAIAGMYEKLKTLLANEPDKNFDAPPKDQLGVSYRCDKNALKLYAEAEKTWKEKFNQYEYDLIRSAMAIERSLQLSSYEESDIDAAFPGLSADLLRAHELYYTRLDEKESKLISTYGKNIFMQHCIITTILAYERQKQLSGRDEKDGEFSTVITNLMNNPELEIYINEQIEKKNWDVILDLPYMLGLQRQAQLLGGSEALIIRLSDLTKKLMNLNRFVLTVDIDFNERYHDDDGEDVLKVNGSIKTIDKVYVSLYPVQCGRWILTTPTFDYSLGIPYFPLQVVSGIKSVKTDKNWESYSYSGPKDMMIYSPNFAIDFTRTNEPDTAVLQILRYVDETPLISVSKAYTTDLTGYLNDVYMKPEETAPSEEKIKDFGKDLLAKFSKTTTQNNTTPLEQLKFKHSIITQKLEATRKPSEIFNTAQTVLLFNAQNGSSNLIDVKLDTKHKNDKVEVVYGIFKLKVVNDPITD